MGYVVIFFLNVVPWQSGHDTGLGLDGFMLLFSP